jgi:hypothetical protein
LTFRVTNESTTASIVRIEVRLPVEARILEVYPIAAADWAPMTTMRSVDGNPDHDIPESVTWITMPGKDIKPGATSELTLAIGPMPVADRLLIDVLQTRSDGTVVTWAGASPAGDAATRHPAFALTLRPDPAATVAEEPVAEEPESGSNGWRILLILLAIGLVTLFAYLWQRRTDTSTRDTATAEPDAATDPDATEDGETADATAPAEPVVVRRKAVVRAPRARSAASRQPATGDVTASRASVAARKSAGRPAGRKPVEPRTATAEPQKVESRKPESRKAETRTAESPKATPRKRARETTATPVNSDI